MKNTDALISGTGKKLVKAEIKKGKHNIGRRETISPGQAVSIDLPAGESVVRSLSLKLGSYNDPQDTRSLVLSITFDGEETVWCPVGDFFGSGIGLHPFHGWYRTVEQDGTMRCRWLMPYRKNATLKLHNFSNIQIDIDLNVTVGKWKWDNRSMYFHANWRAENDIKTRPPSDWNYITIKGKGIYVGDVLMIWNPVPNWWGEGDAKIWVDGEEFPSIFGTGTEDYYGYSWGGANTGFYEHPFHAQVRVNMNEKGVPKNLHHSLGTQGYSTETRSRVLDARPFRSSINVNMEILHTRECKVDYSVATYWYGLPGTTCNVGAEPEKARLKIKQHIY